MITRIALLAVGLAVAGAAHAQAPASPSGAQAASSLQGQKAWDFLTAPPSASRREVPTTGSLAPQPRRSVDRANH